MEVDVPRDKWVSAMLVNLGIALLGAAPLLIFFQYFLNWLLKLGLPGPSLDGLIFDYVIGGVPYFLFIFAGHNLYLYYGRKTAKVDLLGLGVVVVIGTLVSIWWKIEFYGWLCLMVSSLFYWALSRKELRGLSRHAKAPQLTA